MDLTGIESFSEEVGGLGDGAVTCVGGRTQWDVGGVALPCAREVTAPGGIVDFEPAEMVVRVRCGTVVAELEAALRASGQQVALDPVEPERATVGGVLAVGRSGLRRLRYGPVRDSVLEVTVVMADGRVVRAGGPVVKNVSGFDLGRVLVGSLGTIGFLAEVVLRTSPRPPVHAWFRSPAQSDPFRTRGRLFRPSSILWDGTTTWVLLEGTAGEVVAERAGLGPGWVEVGEAPPPPSAGRLSLRPSALRGLEGRFTAEVGVGTVHLDVPVPARPPDPSTNELHRRVKATFDPTGRMNPGRDVLGPAS